MTQSFFPSLLSDCFVLFCCAGVVRGGGGGCGSVWEGGLVFWRFISVCIERKEKFEYGHNDGFVFGGKYWGRGNLGWDKEMGWKFPFSFLLSMKFSCHRFWRNRKRIVKFGLKMVGIGTTKMQIVRIWQTMLGFCFSSGACEFFFHNGGFVLEQQQKRITFDKFVNGLPSPPAPVSTALKKTNKGLSSPRTEGKNDNEFKKKTPFSDPTFWLGRINRHFEKKTFQIR